MNLDAEIRAMAAEHRAWADSLRSPRERARDLRNDMLLGLGFYLRGAQVGVDAAAPGGDRTAVWVHGPSHADRVHVALPLR